MVRRRESGRIRQGCQQARGAITISHPWRSPRERGRAVQGQDDSAEIRGRMALRRGPHVVGGLPHGRERAVPGRCPVNPGGRWNSGPGRGSGAEEHTIVEARTAPVIPVGSSGRSRTAPLIRLGVCGGTIRRTDDSRGVSERRSAVGSEPGWRRPALTQTSRRNSSAWLRRRSGATDQTRVLINSRSLTSFTSRGASLPTPRWNHMWSSSS